MAESTGKHGRGILPVADEPLGEPAYYGEDRVFAYLPDVDAPDAARTRCRRSREAGHPVFTIPTRGPRDLGRVFLLAEIAVAVAGWGLQINPFDQPNVQQAKDATKRVLAAYEASHRLTVPALAATDAVRALLMESEPPQYVAIMAYAQPSDAFDEAAAELRDAIRGATQATTTFGYGPRFLHSTGQFHKGGPEDGAVSAAPRTTVRATSRSPAPRTRSRRSRKPRRSEISTRCASSDCPPSACGWRARTPWARCAH